MLFVDDSQMKVEGAGLEIVNHVGRRQITHAFHDIDGTHSLIRDWPPVMSVCLHSVIHGGLPDDFDSPEWARQLAERSGTESLPETDRFAIESAGFSCLTQMEWAIRRGLQEGTVRIANCEWGAEDQKKNSAALERIQSGSEVTDGLKESRVVRAFLAERVPKLFRLYDSVLRRAGRDRNLEAAREDPEPWLVPGSFEFMKLLFDNDVRNYFVTGAVVTEADGSASGMYEEVLALGFPIGPGKLVEGIYGSSWQKKITKEEAMLALIRKLKIGSSNIMIVGDGRAEIAAAAARLGAVATSRLDRDAQRQREIHRQLGTNYIVPGFCGESFLSLFTDGCAGCR